MPTAFRRLAAVSAALVLAAGGLITLAAAPAGAVVTATVSAGTLNVITNGADNVTVTCSGPGGQVKINGNTDPVPPPSCSAIAAIFVQGQGTFDNTFDLSAVTNANGFT